MERKYTVKHVREMLDGLYLPPTGQVEGHYEVQSIVQRRLKNLREWYDMTMLAADGKYELASFGLFAISNLMREIDALGDAVRQIEQTPDAANLRINSRDVLALNDTWERVLLGPGVLSPQEREEILCVLDPDAAGATGLFQYMRSVAVTSAQSVIFAVLGVGDIVDDNKPATVENIAAIAKCRPSKLKSRVGDLIQSSSSREAAYKAVDGCRLYNEFLIARKVKNDVSELRTTTTLTTRTQWDAGFIQLAASKSDGWCEWMSDSDLMNNLFIPTLTASALARLSLMEMGAANTPTNRRLLDRALLEISTSSVLFGVAVSKLLTVKVKPGDPTTIEFAMASKRGGEATVGRLNVTPKTSGTAPVLPPPPPKDVAVAAGRFDVI